MQEQIKRIKNKFTQLKRADRGFTVFGANTHRYNLNERLSEEDINRFEKKHQITLPEGYVLFLTQIGNGGAGPFYGLEPLKNALFADLDYKNKDYLLDPSQPFLHIKPWNLDFSPTVNEDENEEEYFKQYEAFEEIYFVEKEMNGTIAICNFGCGVKINLVVNGQEYGNVWTDDRVNDGGIYPSLELGNEKPITFLDWYELWLDNSLYEITGTRPSQTDQSKRNSWWKLW
jgi:hypothetical protein